MLRTFMSMVTAVINLGKRGKGAKLTITQLNSAEVKNERSMLVLHSYDLIA